MNEDTLKGKWHQFRGDAKKKWGKLTDDEMDQVDGDMTKMRGLIQERYGKSKEEAEKEVEEWKRDLKH